MGCPAIDWAGAVMAFEKIGYDGVFMFDVTRDWQLDAGSWKLEAGSWKLEAGSYL